MKANIEDIKSKVQATLDELFSKHLIPFKLTAHRVNEDGPGKYVVPFYDSRIHSFEFSWTDGGSSFREVVSAAVLNRVTRMDNPPNGRIAALTPQAKSLESKLDGATVDELIGQADQQMYEDKRRKRQSPRPVTQTDFRNAEVSGGTRIIPLPSCSDPNAVPKRLIETFCDSGATAQKSEVKDTLAISRMERAQSSP